MRFSSSMLVLSLVALVSVCGAAHAGAAAPELLFVLPDSGNITGGDPVGVVGTDFVDGATVRFGVLPGFVTFVNANLLIALTPPGFGTVDVRVQNPDGQGSTLDDAFTYQIPTGNPEVLGVFPDSGGTAGGETVFVFGASFEEGAIVAFDGAASPSVTFLSAGLLQVVVPPGSVGPADVEVCNPGDDCATATNAYSYEEPVVLADCYAGSISPQTDILLVNASAGGLDRRVIVNDGASIFGTLALPPAGGNGKFVLHANLAVPSSMTEVELPLSIGTFCFEIFLGRGATPAAVYNNIGKESRVGASMYFDGSPIADPDVAPTLFLNLMDGDSTNLPAGTVFTMQAVIRDPASPSPKGASVSNAIVVEVL